MTFAKMDTIIHKKKKLIKNHVRKEALNVCDIASKRIYKNIHIKWTKEAYKKYKPYTKAAIFNFVTYNSALLDIGFRPWYLTVYPTHDIKQKLPLKSISHYKRHHYDYSLLKLRKLPDYDDDDGTSIDEYDKFAKRFTESCRKNPFKIVRILELCSLVDNCIDDLEYP